MKPVPETKNSHGGKRPGAGRKPLFSRTEVAQRMLDYARTIHAPSIRHFSERTGISTKTLRRWELRHPDIANAIGVLRYRQDVDMGRAA